MGEQFRLRALFGCSGGIFTKEVGPAGGFFLFCFGVCVCVCVPACLCVCGKGVGSFVFCFEFGLPIVVRSLPMKSRTAGIVTYLVIWPHVT